MISLVVTLVIIGVLLFLFNTYVTLIDARFKQLINVVVIAGTILWLCWSFGLFSRDIPIPRLP